jgi:antitoxin FitA
MSTLTFTMTEEKASRLNDAAREIGVPVEDLLRRITDDFLSRKDGFEAAANYVLQKNSDLYQRLATQ